MTDKEMEKVYYKENLKSSFEQTLDARVERYFEINYNKNNWEFIFFKSIFRMY